MDMTMLMYLVFAE